MSDEGIAQHHLQKLKDSFPRILGIDGPWASTSANYYFSFLNCPDLWFFHSFYGRQIPALDCVTLFQTTLELETGWIAKWNAPASFYNSRHYTITISWTHESVMVLTGVRAREPSVT